MVASRSMGASSKPQPTCILCAGRVDGSMILKTQQIAVISSSWCVVPNWLMYRALATALQPQKSEASKDSQTTLFASQGFQGEKERKSCGITYEQRKLERNQRSDRKGVIVQGEALDCFEDRRWQPDAVFEGSVRVFGGYQAQILS